MGKVKQYAEDTAEKAVDKIILQVKQNLITKETASADILKVENVAIIGIDEDNVDEVIKMECA
tara:strand:+ start:1152 stop:1340 length:189 start_codon:yes stop_codon:yes gene_type:complete